MEDAPAAPDPVDPPSPPAPERTRELEELLFACLEARSQGDASRLAQLMPSDPAELESLRQLLAIADGLHGDRPLQRLGEYELLHELGGGGMGVVHLARQNRLQRLVAIKLIRPEMLASAKMRERFHREARALARVAHPGICPIYDFGESDGQPFLVMQYLPGKRLSELPAPTNRRELDVRLQQFQQVCEAVQVAHDAGLVHRDLKPQNIVLAADGRPVVLDFGLARILDDGQADQGLTTQSQPVGTPAYLAPERLAGQANATGPGVDVYALGVSLYQSVTGQLPFHSPVLEALWSQILRGEASARPLQQRWMPKELLVVVRTAMEREPARRYASAQSLGEDLRRLRLDLPILAQRPSTATRVLRWTRRNRAVAALLGGLAVAFAVALLLVLGLVAERRHNRSQALAGEATRHQQRNPALQAALALAAIDEEDQVGARSELAQSLADWQLQTRLVDRESHSPGAIRLPQGGMAALDDERAVVTSRPLAGRSRFERPDGGPIASCAIRADEQQLALGGGDGTLWLIPLSGGEPTKIPVGDDSIALLRYGPGDAHLAIATDRADGTGARTATLHALARATTRPRMLGSFTGNRLLALDFLFPQDGSELWTVLQGQCVIGHRLQDGEVTRRIAHDDDPIVAARFVRDDTALACGTRGGRVFEVRRHDGAQTALGSHDDMVLAMAQSADGRTLLTAGNDRTAKLWDLQRPPGPQEPVVLHHPVLITNACFHPDGQLVATGANDMIVRLWTRRGDNVLELGSGLGATNLLAYAGEQVWLGSEWNGSGSYRLEAHGRGMLLGQAPVSALHRSRRTDTVWTGHADGSLRAWTAAGTSLLPESAREAIVSIRTDDAETVLLAVAERDCALVHDFGDDSWQRLAVEAGQLQAGWLLREGREIWLQSTGARAVPHANQLTRYCRDATSGLFAAAGDRPLPPGLGGGTLDRRTGNLLLPRPRRGGRGGFLVLDPTDDAPPREIQGEPCSLVACAPSGDLIATCMTSSVQLRHGLDDRSPLPLQTDSSGTNCLAFSPDGRHLAAFSRSGAVWVFSTSDGQLVWQARVPAIGWCVTFTPDGRHLLTGDSDGVVRHWLVEPQAQRALAEERLRGWQWDAEDERILRENGVALTRPR